MLRSEINCSVAEALEILDHERIRLPSWAYWTAERWREVGPEAAELREHGLGWNITDFGSGDFERVGLLICVTRNGCLHHGRPATTKTYAEKVFVVGPGQLTPWHFHWLKTEDLINRAGGNLKVEVAWAADDEISLSDRQVSVQVDGITRQVAPGSTIAIGAGESITFPPRLCHKFQGGASGGKVIAGEISSLNDDATDNCFLGMSASRTPIVEDEPAKYLLFDEYPQFNPHINK